jgi:hypothetical protein
LARLPAEHVARRHAAYAGTQIHANNRDPADVDGDERGLGGEWPSPP